MEVKLKKVLLFTILILGIGMVNAIPIMAGAALQIGAKGDDVAALQAKLKQLNYYDGDIDGDFGQATATAVKQYQQDNGLLDTGEVDQDTAEHLGITISYSWSNQDTMASKNNRLALDGDIYLLAKCVYAEAKEASYTEQVAIAAVILNRVKDPSFPNTIAGVVYQPGAFTFVSDGTVDSEPNTAAIKAAHDAMNGWDPSGGAVFFFNGEEAENALLQTRERTIAIGAHVFYG